MSQDNLQNAVEELRAEFEALSIEDQDTRAHISELLATLENQLDDEGVRTTQAQMPTLVERFEVEHPRLTQVLQRILVSLQDMGI